MRPIRALVVLLLVLVLIAAGARYVFPQAVLSLALDLEHRRSGLVKHEAELPGGLRMSYLEGGRGEPLVLLHGFGADKDNFTRVARFLTPQYHLIIPDLVGFGDSSRPAEADYSPTAQAERVRALCQGLGLTSVHLGGSSMGGHIAMRWLVAHPREVRSLWLLDPGGVWSGPESEAGRIFRETGHSPLVVESEDEFAELIKFTMSRPPPIPRFLQDVMAHRRMANRPLEERILRQVRADSVEVPIAGVRTSALIVFGANDRVIHPGTAEVLKKLLPRGHVVIMPGIGHLPALEAPEHVASDYIRFRDSM